MSMTVTVPPPPPFHFFCRQSKNCPCSVVLRPDILPFQHESLSLSLSFLWQHLPLVLLFSIITFLFSSFGDATAP